MRTLKNVVGVLVLSMLFSCNNQNTPAINTDYTNTKNLVGTTWRCSDFSKTKNPCPSR